MAAAVLLAGYVPLILFWTLGNNPAGVPGLFDYHDATWGDGLLLPLLAFFLWILIGRLAKLPRAWPTWIAAAGGAAAGALLIYTWWVDPHPSPNWTLPRPHYFTIAGKWHAVFLVAASAFFAGSWVELLRRVRASGPDDAARVLASPATAGAVACTAGYAWLAAADSARFAQTASGRGSLLALVCAGVVLIACLKWAARSGLRPVVRSAVAGLLGAAAIALLIDAYGRTGTFMLLVALAGSLAAGVALAGAPGRQDGPGLEMIAVPALFATLTLMAVRSSRLPVVVLAPLLAIVFSVALRHLYSGGQGRRGAWLSVNYLAGAGISACLLAAGIFGLWLGEHRTKEYITAAFLLTIIGAVLGGVFLPYFKVDYEKLMQIEGDPDMRKPDGRPSDEQHQAATEAWPRLGGYAVSSTASMLVLTVALAPSLGWQEGQAAVAWPVPLTIALVAAVLATPAARAVAEARIRHPGPDRPRPPRGGSRYAWCCVAAGTAVAAIGGIWFLPTARLNPLALFQAALLTGFTLLNMLSNGAWLHTRRIHPAARLAIAVNSLAVFLVIYWSLTDAVRPRGSAATVGSSFAAFISAVLLVAVLVVTTACATYVADGQPYRTDYPPVEGVSQDTFLVACMWFLLGWVPQTVLTHVPAGTHERWSAVGTILAGFLLLFGPAFLWILENNDTHVERQRRVLDVAPVGVLADLASATSSVDRIGTLPRRVGGLAKSVRESRKDPHPELTKHEFLVRLSGHTAVQNSIALLLASATVIGIVGVSSGLGPSAVGATGLPRQKYPEPTARR